MGKKGKNTLGRSLIKDRFGHVPKRTVGDKDVMVSFITVYFSFSFFVEKNFYW